MSDKNTHFLKVLTEDNKKKKLISSVEQSVDKIAEERVLIGKNIQNLIEEGYTKKEILDIISSKTFLSIQAISSMIEEYSFNNDFDLDFLLTSNEIKIIKKIFKDNKFSYSEQQSFLKQHNLSNILEEEYKKILIDRKDTYKHVISFDEEGEILFKNLKDILEKKLLKKISNSELVYYALIELYNSNPEDFKLDIHEECDI